VVPMFKPAYGPIQLAFAASSALATPVAKVAAVKIVVNSCK